MAIYSADDDAVQEFFALFAVSESAVFYRAAPQTDSGGDGKKLEMTYFPIDGSAELHHFVSHLNGERALSIVLNVKGDDGLRNHVIRAAVDIDDYGLDPAEIQAKLDANKIPAALTISKSGGIHVHLLFRTRIHSRMARRLVEQVGGVLGIEKADYFPKQELVDYDAVLEPNGNKGNGLNLCYFGDNRIGWWNGNLSLAEFVDRCLALSMDLYEVEELIERLPIPASRSRALVTVAQAVEDDRLNKSESEFFNGPPCLQRIAAEARAGNKLDNNRNNYLYNAAVYYKFAASPDGGDTLADMLFAPSQGHLLMPFGIRELLTIGGSVFKTKNANYKCKDDPIAGYCNRAACTKRLYGVSQQGIKPWFTLEITIPITEREGGSLDADSHVYTMIFEDTARGRSVDGLGSYTFKKTPSFAEVKRIMEDRELAYMDGMDAASWANAWSAAKAAAVRIEVKPEEGKQGMSASLVYDFIKESRKAKRGHELLDLQRGEYTVWVDRQDWTVIPRTQLDIFMEHRGNLEWKTDLHKKGFVSNFSLEVSWSVFSNKKKTGGKSVSLAVYKVRASKLEEYLISAGHYEEEPLESEEAVFDNGVDGTGIDWSLGS